MSREIGKKRTWSETFAACVHPRVVAMLFLGFSAGLPILLIFSTLSAWLTEAGVSKASVTFFSWAALGYSFKFIWAPLVDLLPLPVLTRVLGRRRSWLLVSQLLIMTAILWMGLTSPTGSGSGLTVMALAAVMLGFSSATQDIVIDAYRIESSEQSMQAMLASAYIAGYRIGMLVAGAGSLYLASWFGTSIEMYDYSAWRYTYVAMAGVMLVGVVTTFVIPEPVRKNNVVAQEYTTVDYTRILTLFLLTATTFAIAFFFCGKFSGDVRAVLAEQFPLSGRLLGFAVELLRFVAAIGAAAAGCWLLVMAKLVPWSTVHEIYVLPVKDFFIRYGLKTALLILMLVGCYKISDIVLGVISNIFYLEIGFSKNDIATVTKTFGLFMTIIGGLLGGVLTVRYGVIKILFAGAVLSAATNLLFMLLAATGADLTLFTIVIAADNLSGGLAATAFVAFLSSLTSVSFTAVQYAIFSSTMTLFPKLLGGYSGTIVASVGYETFFLLTACIGIPVLLLIWLVRDYTVGQPS